jgi:acetolactate synthase-1/2/3 large subunit
MTKYAETVYDKNEIKYHLETAWNECVNKRPGPVWLDVPLDIQASEIDVESLKSAQIFDESDNSKQIELLKSCFDNFQKSKPVVVIGNGIKSSGTINELKNFIQKYQLPVVSGPHSAVDIINYDYEFYTGKIGILGQKTSNQIIQQADFIISLGSRLNPKVIGYDLNKFAPNAKKIVIDVDNFEIKKFDQNDSFIGINLDLKNFFEFFETYEANFDIREWLDYIKLKRSEEQLVLDKHRKLENYVSTYVFSEKLEEFLDDDSIIVTSDGTAHVVLHKTVRLRSNQQLFSNEGTAPMGYGLPAAIGAYYGCNKTIICIEGDGSIMMNLQELQTVVHHNLPIKIFILNNDGYLSIKLTQNSFFKGNLVGSEPSSGVSLPNFKKISDAFGIKYSQILNNNQLDLMQSTFSHSGPEIIEVMTDPWELHEPKVSAKGIDENGKIIPGSLEDIK